MKFFVDTAEIKSPAAGGLLDGVTINPSLVAKTGKEFADTIGEIPAVAAGPVSAEMAATDYYGMLGAAHLLREIGENVTKGLAAFQPGWPKTGQSVA
jgi:transaldolase